ncbi:MAG: hypothetical protein LBE80_02200 [Deltaproteobacteria bacterium]|jgi:serine/threonine protein kinase|nr:hypothetical protein [Deltaproteobacteria bacterium]
MTFSKSLPKEFSLDKYSIKQTVDSNENCIYYNAIDNKLNSYVIIEELFPKEIAVRQSDGTVTNTNEDKFKSLCNHFNSDTVKMITLVHPNICQALGHFSANGTVYRVFQRFEGETLQSILNKKQPGGFLPENQLTSFLSPILDALRFGHNQNILHLNLNPETIFIEPNGTPVLFKFGDSLSPQKPEYQAPELEGRQGNLGPWTDMFALGGVLFKGFVGKDPVSALLRKMAMESGSDDPLKADLAALAERDPVLAEAIKTSLLLNFKTRTQDAQSFKAIVESTSGGLDLGAPLASPLGTPEPRNPDPYGDDPGGGDAQQAPPGKNLQGSEGPYDRSQVTGPEVDGAPVGGFLGQTPPFMGQSPFPHEWGLGTNPNSFYRKPRPLPYAVSRDQIRELRQAALFGDKKAAANSGMLKEFTDIDAGLEPKFNGLGLVLGPFYLTYFTKIRGFIVLVLAVLINIVFITIFRQNSTIINIITWICVWLFSAYFVNGLTYFTISNEISSVISFCQGNLEQSKAILVKMSKGHKKFTFRAIILACVYILLFIYLIPNLPVCKRDGYLATINKGIHDSFREQTNLSEDYIAKNVSFEITNIKTLEKGFQNCKCSALLIISDVNGRAEVLDIEYLVDTSKGSFLEYDVSLESIE